MIRNTTLSTTVYFCPLRNTTPMCVTQDIPFELDADVLLLGCGDCRNILFTCHADQRRKIDVTCCDIEPLIHARNVLLYTLLIDDKENSNVNQIWNIYFHWKIDKSSLELLETQVLKLLLLSESIDQWHSSVYGSSIRFCSESSLASVRFCWKGFKSLSLSPCHKNLWQERMQAAIQKAKRYRKFMAGGKENSVDITGLTSVCPTFKMEAAKHLPDFTKQWWEHGTTIPFDHAAATKPTDLNPTFLFSSDQRLILHYTTSPVHGFPLSDACVPTAFAVQNKSVPWKHHLIDCVLNHFTLWASAFRKAVEKESVLVRIFVGDALNFCLTLRNCSESTLTNMFCHNLGNIPLVLYPKDYDLNVRTAPLRFDVISSSNLIHLGLLNLLTIGASLLKQHASSSLILKFNINYNLNVADPLSRLFDVDIRTMSLILGLVPPDLFTNSVSTVNTTLDFSSLELLNPSETQTSRLCFRWRRIKGRQAPDNSPFLDVDAKSLAKFLIQVHNFMFWYEDLPSFRFFSDNEKRIKYSNLAYNRASFAFLLSFLQSNIICDWNQCLKDVYNAVIIPNEGIESYRGRFEQDLITNLHLFKVDSNRFRRPTLEDTHSAILRTVLPAGDLPDLLCVTLQVPRARIRFLTEADPKDLPRNPAIFCSIQSALEDPVQWMYFFSSVQVAFGKWYEQTKDGVTCPYIIEDRLQLFGISDMFVSVMVPTSILLSSKQYVPLTTCGFMITALNHHCFSKYLGPDLLIALNKMTSKNVFITRFMPQMSALPLLTVPSCRQMEPIDTTLLRFTDDGLKIKNLVKRVFFSSELDKVDQNLKSPSLTLSFESPFSALACTNDSSEVKLTFPAPVSLSKSRYNFCGITPDHKLHFEVISNFFDPLDEEAGFFILPTFLTNTFRNSIIPLPWTSSNLDLDVLPQVLKKDLETIQCWLLKFIEKMFSDREKQIHNSKTRADIRTELKCVFSGFFLRYMGLVDKPGDFFALTKKCSDIQDIQTLIFPSCFRLDLANGSVVLDCALIPMTDAVRSDPKMFRLLQELLRDTSYFTVSDAENRAWKAMMPALAERCRTWRHTADCEYAQVGEVPLPKGLSEDGESPICSCGVGKFSENYLKDQIKRFPTLKPLLNKYATRGAISPIFALPCVEDCQGFKRNRSTMKTEILEKCDNCGSDKRKNAPAGQASLLVCSRCKLAKYCSTNCQRTDWKRHKALCARK